MGTLRPVWHHTPSSAMGWRGDTRQCPLCLTLLVLQPAPAWDRETLEQSLSLGHQHRGWGVPPPSRSHPCAPHPVPTSAVMRAMRSGAMAPHSTFLRNPGFLGSFRLLILLRTRLRYFMSVLFSSWKICGDSSRNQRDTVEWGVPAPRAPTAAPVRVVLVVTRAGDHVHVEVAGDNRALLPGGPRVGSPPPRAQEDEAQLGMWGGKQLCISLL